VKKRAVAIIAAYVRSHDACLLSHEKREIGDKEEKATMRE